MSPNKREATQLGARRAPLAVMENDICGMKARAQGSDIGHSILQDFVVVEIQFNSFFYFVAGKYEKASL